MAIYDHQPSSMNPDERRRQTAAAAAAGALPGAIQQPPVASPGAGPAPQLTRAPVAAAAAGAGIAAPLTRAATQLPTMTVGPYAAQDMAPAWTGGGSPRSAGGAPGAVASDADIASYNAGRVGAPSSPLQRQLPGGISMMRGADGVPIFTNVPANTRADLIANNGKLPMTADQSLTFPGVASLVRDTSGNYTGATSGVEGSASGPRLTRASFAASGLPGAIGGDGGGGEIPGAVAPAGPAFGSIAQRNDPTNYGSIASRNNSGLVRPALDSLPGAVPYDPQGDIEEAQRNAQSDILSALTKDPRSPIGIAARNLSVDAASTGPGRDLSGHRLHRGRYLDGDGDNGTGGLIGNIQNNTNQIAAAALQHGREEGDTTREAMRNATTLGSERIRAGAEFNKPTLQPTDDGGLLQVTGTQSRQVMDQAGKPARVLLKKEDATAHRSETVLDALAKTAAGQLTNSVLPGKQPTNEQIAAARLAAARVHGLRTASGEGRPPLVEIADGQWVPL